MHSQTNKMAIINTDNILSIRNFAKQLKGRNGTGVTTQRVYNLIKHGALVPLDIDGIKFLKRSDLLAMNKNKLVKYQ